MTAISEYQVLRKYLVEKFQELTPANPVFVVEGWGNTEALEKILIRLRQSNAIRKVKFKKRLRIDLPPLFGKRSLLWGFQLEIHCFYLPEIQKVPDFITYLLDLLENIDFTTPTYKCVDSVRVKRKRFPKAIDDKFITSNLDLVIEVIEATCDFEAANLLFQSRFYEKLSTFSKSIIFLLSDQQIWPDWAFSENTLDKVWIEKPNWQVINHQQVGVKKPELVSGKFGYQTVHSKLAVNTLQSSWFQISNCEISGIGILLAGGEIN